MTDCPFCLSNWPNLDIVDRFDDTELGEIAIINPLNPVTEGHVLVIAAMHSADAAACPDVTGGLMTVAAAYVGGAGIQANIITSIGEHATQTVFHTHIHVVPRQLNDGLPLPWTPQQLERERHRRVMERERWEFLPGDSAVERQEDVK